MLGKRRGKEGRHGLVGRTAALRLQYDDTLGVIEVSRSESNAVGATKTSQLRARRTERGLIAMVGDVEALRYESLFIIESVMN
jgi:hypothetical protein